jgi:hypothetical protein
MALPVIEAPKYHLTIPSSGQTVEYRPFLVREEKILMIAQETNTQTAMVSALKDIVKSCTFGKLDLYTLTMYDIEYIFLNLRGKSVGETSEISVKCSECEEYVPLTINLTEVEVITKDEQSDTIELTPDVGIKLKAPGLREMERSAKLKNTNNMTEGIMSVIESIYDADSVYEVSNTDPKELETFIDSLSHQQLLLIQEWITNMPRLEHKIEFTCKNGHKNERVLSGLSDFFA